MNRTSILPFALSALACGSRGPLDFEGAADASVDAPLVLVDAGVDAKPVVDAGPSLIEELIGCGLCITQKCGEKVNRCIQDPACSRVLQCVSQKCLLSGLSLQCIQGCTTEPESALKAFEIIQCITGVCSDSCSGGLPPIGGIGGFGN